MTRVLMIDADRPLAQSAAMAWLETGVAVRIAETLCEGVRYMLDAPVSAVLVDPGLLRLGTGDQAHLFELVAPGVPVIVLVGRGVRFDERVKWELAGFQVVAKPFDARDVLAKIPMEARALPASPATAAEIEEICGREGQ